MICILGDLHLRSDKKYFIDTCNKFLDWFRDWDWNKDSNELILAGDLVEQATPGGITISFLERLVSESKFKKIHICVGNHDDKKINGIQQLAYEFLNYKDNVIIYRTPREVTIDGHSALILPYYVGVNDLGLTMKEYYSNIPNNKKFKNDYDLVVGHFSGSDALFSELPDCIANLDRFSGRVCLGHIHTRTANPQRYLGSVFAGRKSENDYTRAAWGLDDNGWQEYPLPLFNEFLTVAYPQDLPKSKALVPIYTILNCGSEDIARQRYGNIYIRRLTLDLVDSSVQKNSDLDRQLGSIKEFNIRELFEEFLKSRSDISPDLASKCRGLLNT